MPTRCNQHTHLPCKTPHKLMIKLSVLISSETRSASSSSLWSTLPVRWLDGRVRGIWWNRGEDSPQEEIFSIDVAKGNLFPEGRKPHVGNTSRTNGVQWWWSAGCNYFFSCLKQFVIALKLGGKIQFKLRYFTPSFNYVADYYTLCNIYYFFFLL